MNHPLLHTLLGEDHAIRDATLAQVRRLAARRRRRRTAARLAAITGLVFVAGFVASRLVPTPPPPPAPAVAEITTTAVPRGMIVRTSPMLPPDPTAPSASIPTVTTRPGAWDPLRTHAPSPELLTDRELLVLLAPHRGALIEPGTPRARVVFP